MPNKKSGQSKTIRNRRATFDYDIEDSLVVGIQLSGGETKSLRLGQGNLRGAYVTIKNGELWLINSLIGNSQGVNLSVDEQTRSRKLLAKRREINHLMEAKQQGRTIVPLELLNRGHFIKVRIAIGKGKKRYDKRHAIKEREANRRSKSLY